MLVMMVWELCYCNKAILLHLLASLLAPKQLSTHEKEYLAMLIAVDQWWPYLQQGEPIIFTDQKSLIHVNEKILNTPRHQKVSTKLLGMQYKIIYKKGSENRDADALSRRAHDIS